MFIFLHPARMDYDNCVVLSVSEGRVQTVEYLSIHDVIGIKYNGLHIQYAKKYKYECENCSLAL